MNLEKLIESLKAGDSFMVLLKDKPNLIMENKHYEFIDGNLKLVKKLKDYEVAELRMRRLGTFKAISYFQNKSVADNTTYAV